MKSTATDIKPFLRWAGGKTWLTKQIDNFLPTSFKNYYEPFLGGGSIFFHLLSQNMFNNNVFLSDSNKDLINAYQIVKSNADSLINDLKKHKNEENYYYKIRSQAFDDPIKSASRFIFLNRTSFNGIYRENLKGEYNVPYGHKTYRKSFNYENIKTVSKYLNDQVKFSANDFNTTLEQASKDDLVFLDPPYTVAHSNNGFIKYNQRIFSWDDQIRLYETIKKLNERDVKFILTNAFHKNVVDLYKDLGKLKKLRRYSVVGGKGAKREKYTEILITNIS